MKIRTAFFVSLFVPFMVFSQIGHAELIDPLRYLPVQDGGRIKPFETFAQESLQLVYGRTDYNKRSAVSIVFTWMLAPELWDKEQMVLVRFKGLKTALALEDGRSLYSPEELFKNERLGYVMQELRSIQETKQKLNPYFQAVQTLESQLGLYHAIRSGKLPRFVPPREGEAWLAPSEMPAPLREKLLEMSKAFIQSLDPESKDKPMDQTLTSEFASAVSEFSALARAENPALYGDPVKISTEVHYKQLHPFKWSWIIYLCASLVLLVALILQSQIAYRLSWIFVSCALALQTYGFGLRVYITGRAPVSNMYETVIWVAFGAIVFAMIFEAIYRRRYILLSGCVISILCLVVADMAPTILDRSLQPLEPVLRSNYWLTIHVLTITLSYSAFFLAFGLGNYGLFYFLRGEQNHSPIIREIARVIYRSVQVGVVLLAAGIILGGIWADYSWGRFWGWDPKETWALIALLGYLAVLHGRLAGWLKEMGVMAGVVVSFNLVIMAWYGVNYVLGAGLHSYGFGAGGIEYVGSFVGLNLIYVSYVVSLRLMKRASI